MKKQAILLILTFILVMVLCGAVSAESGTWKNDTVQYINDNMINPDWSSIAVGSDNVPRIAWYEENSTSGKNSIKYAYKSSTGWEVETIDSNIGSTQGYPSVAVDDNNNVGVAYAKIFSSSKTGEESLIFASRTSTGWIPETVGECDAVDGISLAYYKGSQPAIAFYDTSKSTGNTVLYYTVRTTSGQWATLPVDEGSQLSGCKLIYTNYDSTPNIIYTANGYQKFKIAIMNAYPSWTKDETNTVNFFGKNWDAALDSNGKPYIIYAVSTPADTLMLYYKLAGIWVTDTVAEMTGGALITNSAIAVDSSGNLHICYQATDLTMNYVLGTYIEGILGPVFSYAKTVLENNIDYDNRLPLTLNTDGSPRIVWTSNDIGMIKYYYFTPKFSKALTKIITVTQILEYFSHYLKFKSWYKSKFWHKYWYKSWYKSSSGKWKFKWKYKWSKWKYKWKNKLVRESKVSYNTVVQYV